MKYLRLLFCKASLEYKHFGNYDKALETHKVIDIVPQRSDYTSFIDCFDDFLLNLAQTCERYPRDQLLVSHLSFPDYVKLLSQILSVTASTAAA